MAETAAMSPGAKKIRDFYNRVKDAPFYREEFGFYSFERWKADGYLNDDDDLSELFGYDEPGKHFLGRLGGCEAAFSPCFEETVLEDRGGYELVLDFAGRSVLYFKGRRNGFMPEYVDHPVKDMLTWERDVKWRLDPAAPKRFAGFDKSMRWAKLQQANGLVICQNMVGGYMYLRSLIGPEGILYMVYDNPRLVHDCMKAWFELADAVIARHQEHVTLDEIFLSEDICYKSGPLISPDMMREFLFPYYNQLIANAKDRQKGKAGHLFIQIDTDGDCRPVIPVYREIGMDYISPMEAAAGCDVVAVRKQYPELLLRGGIDKRILAQSKDNIDRELERILPFMREQGGYIPTCDHGVPEEVPFDNYLHYRRRFSEYAG